MRFFAKDHEAAQPEAYEEAAPVVSQSLDAGARSRARGTSAPRLVLPRRPLRPSLRARDRLRAHFGLRNAGIHQAHHLRSSPRTGPTDRLHLDLICRLVPEWTDQPFFEAPTRKCRRSGATGLGRSNGTRAVFEEILASWRRLDRDLPCRRGEGRLARTSRRRRLGQVGGLCSRESSTGTPSTST